MQEDLYAAALLHAMVAGAVGLFPASAEFHPVSSYLEPMTTNHWSLIELISTAHIKSAANSSGRSQWNRDQLLGLTVTHTRIS